MELIAAGSGTVMKPWLNVIEKLSHVPVTSSSVSRTVSVHSPAGTSPQNASDSYVQWMSS